MSNSSADHARRGGTDPQSALDASGPGFERSSSFVVPIVSVLLFMGFYIVSIEGIEGLLDEYFRNEVESAVELGGSRGPVVTTIQNRVSDLVQESPWVRYGGVRVNVTVLGADGLTPLYVGGGPVAPPPPRRSLGPDPREALDLLPAITDVIVSVPHGSALSVGIFFSYGVLLLQGLFIHNRRTSARGRSLLEAAMAERELSTHRAQSIEEELAKVRLRLNEVEPAERSHVEEIQGLQRERQELREKLRRLAERENALRTSASRNHELEEERQTLEDLLDEALGDVTAKESEIAALEEQLRSASRKQASSSRGRSKEAERLSKRMRTLYKNLEFDDRALSDLASLGDESLKLRAEEVLKRLDDDPDTAAVRRKVGGLPPSLSIYELGYAGKGRIYYSRSEGAAYRILAIGGKATQKQDLEYLSRLSA